MAICGAAFPAAEQGGSKSPVTITSRTLELDHTGGKVTFKGNVKAVQDDMVIQCQEMDVLYQVSSGDTQMGPEDIKEIIARGGVLLNQGDREVRGDVAHYYHNERKIIITGNPKLKQGLQHVQGSKIVVFLDQKRFLVEGGADSPVEAVIFPGGTH
ncbi:MAG: hypothetical protein HY788_23275 [Deltaproteobacteria bacterium]|nr:hypothetical protein [Deltaproteobacteria bacterium]